MAKSSPDLPGPGPEPVGPLEGDTLLEREKYEKVWADDRYRRHSPGEGLVQIAFEELEMALGGSLIDYGCGTGRALIHFRDWGLEVTGVDIAANCMEAWLPFVRACLWELPPVSSDWAYCTDVMEHIPENRVDDVLHGIRSRTAKGAFFQIAMRPDASGPLIIGEQLHLTIKPIEWWKRRLEKHWPEVHMEDLTTRCLAVCR